MKRPNLPFLLASAIFAAACGESSTVEPADTETETSQSIGPLPDAPSSDFGSADATPEDPCLAVDCSALDTDCLAGVCDPLSGECTTVAVADGVVCSDGVACTAGDACIGGECTGVPVVCASAPCAPSACDEATGTCATVELEPGSVCDDGSLCTAGDTCVDGNCVGAPLDCTGAGSDCARGVCDPAVGCVAAPLSDGSPCGESAGCGFASSCAAGVCVDQPVDCSAGVGPCEVGSCGDDGLCVRTPREAGSGCDDGDLCTIDDVCDAAGACVGAPKSCAAAADVCNAEACDPVDGACRPLAGLDGVPCSDGDACTTADVCEDGACGGVAIDCVSLAGSCASGACVPGVGCELTNAPAGDACADDRPDDCLTQRCDGGGSCLTTLVTDCTPCGDVAGGVCTAGVCGADLPELRFDFEGAALPGALRGDWAPSFAAAWAGERGLRSAPTPDGGSSSLTLSADVHGGASARISFWVHVQAAEGDALVFEVDGVEQGRWSGPTPWTLVSYPSVWFTGPLTSGTHVFEWRYEKDAAGADFLDAAFVDDVVVRTATDALTFEDGTLEGLTVSAGWASASDTAAFGERSLVFAGVAGGRGATAQASFELSRAGSVVFWARTDASAAHGLRVLLDGAEELQLLGLSDWRRYEVQVAEPGAHEISWVVEGGLGRGGIADAVWLDQISFSEGLCE